MFHCSRQDALWTQITTDWEHLYGLTIIKSWRIHFLKEKISTIGQAIWTLFSPYLFPKPIFKLNSVIKNREKSFLEVFSSEPHDSVHAETYMNSINSFFFNVYVSLEDHSSPLHVQNEASPRSKFSPYFFLLISFKAPQDLKTVDGN